jgi:hypothetical protein
MHLKTLQNRDLNITLFIVALNSLKHLCTDGFFMVNDRFVACNESEADSFPFVAYDDLSGTFSLSSLIGE